MKAEAALQRQLLELADVDAELSRLTHRGSHLPEQQRYEELDAARRESAERFAALDIALSDLDALIARQESEVDSVRQREERDRGLLDGGAVNAKQVEELAHELGTLRRRRENLEDALLEMMERREQLAADHDEGRRSIDALEQEMAEAAVARDAALADIEGARAERSARRAHLVAGLSPDLLEPYERQRASAGIGAARLLNGRCGACRIELDRGELARISAAEADEVPRCPECRALLVRGAG